MAFKLTNNLFTMWREVTDAGPDGERAFSRYAARQTRVQALLTSAMITLCAVVWWPVDYAVMPDQDHIDAFFQLRVSICAVMGVAFGTFWFAAPSPDRTWLMSVVFYAMFLASIGLALGRIGTTSWLADAYLGIVPIGFLLMPLRQRVVATSAVALALVVAYFAPYPANLEAPDALGQVSFAVFAVLFSVAAGEIMHRITRRAFFEQRAAERVNGELAELTETLEERVAEQTRELRALAQHTSQLQEAERRRLARDLHDDLGQHLTAMRYTISRIEQLVASDADSDSTLMLVEDLEALLTGTTSTMHGVVARLRPRILDDLGLEAALSWLCERTRESSGLSCELEVTSGFQAHSIKLDPAQALILFRAAQEALTNALKHGEPNALLVHIDATDETATAVVTDDGHGFQVTTDNTPSAPQSGGFGLIGLRERVRSGEGQLTIHSSPGQGVEVRVVLPLAAPTPIHPNTLHTKEPT